MSSASLQPVQKKFSGTSAPDARPVTSAPEMETPPHVVPPRDSEIAAPCVASNDFSAAFATREPKVNVEQKQADRFVVRAWPLPSSTVTSRPLQQWEGVVVFVEANGFDAILTDLTESNRPKERTHFSLGEVLPDDRSLLKVGAVFYWFIGCEISKSRQRNLVSSLRFRRLPAWTKSEIEAVRRDADEMERLLGIQRPAEDGTRAS
jgi:hypothetical protein